MWSMDRCAILAENDDFAILGKPGSISGQKLDTDISMRDARPGWRVFQPQITSTNSYEVVLVTKNACALARAEQIRRDGLLQKDTYVLVHGNVDSSGEQKFTDRLRSALAKDNVVRVKIIANYRCNSNVSGWLSLLCVVWAPLHSTNKLKSALRSLELHVAGRGRNCLKLASVSGTCLLTCGISLPGIHVSVPEKLGRLRAIGSNEDQFWQAKTSERETELLVLGVYPLEAAKAAQQRVPVSHFSGSKTFDGVVYKSGHGVFEPRSSSLCLVETVALRRNDLLDTKDLIVLDLGTGTGCLLLALLKRLPSNWHGVGIDISHLALDCASENARQLGLHSRVEFTLCDYSSEPLPALPFPVGVVVCNPPYLSDKVCSTNNMRYDPTDAAAGGARGLDAYHWVASVCHALHVSQSVIPGAWLVLEVPGNDRTRHDQIAAMFLQFAPSLTYCGYGVPDALMMDRSMSWRFECNV